MKYLLGNMGDQILQIIARETIIELKLISCFLLPWPGVLVAACLVCLVLVDLPGLRAILAVFLLVMGAVKY